MRFFISSVVAGFEPFREAVATAVRSLGHEVIRSEDFTASSATSQVTCLSGVRSSDAVVLLLGDRYGSVQATGKSPTHEEFEAARESKPVFVFIQDGIAPEPREMAFIDEVRDWSTGRYTGQFTDDDTLRSAVTTAIHRWEVESATARIDPEEMASRAIARLPKREHQYRASDPSIMLSLVGAPRQTILRPSQIEDCRFQRDLQQRAFFGEPSLFDTSEGIDVGIEDHGLRLRQTRQFIALSEDGSLLLGLGLQQPERGLSAVIEEDVREAVLKALLFCGGLLDRLDPTEKLSRLAVALALSNSGGGEWRARSEHRQNPSSMRLSLRHDDSIARVMLSPPDRARAAFRQTYSEMAEDLTILLRRHFQN